MMRGKEIGSAQPDVRLTPEQQKRKTTSIASYQKWTINTKMMKVDEGKAVRSTGENKFLVNTTF